MQINLQLIPSPPNPDFLSNRVVVVIDVLRSTSVMTHALSQGALEIIPMVTVEEAFQRAKFFPQGSVLLGGEMRSKRILGFDLGNSPREYVSERVKGKRLILTTTNGTKAFHLVSSGREIFVGSFSNIGAVARRVLELDRDLFIFPSGDEGDFSLEDTLCGGMLIDLIAKEEKKSIALTDAAHCAQILYQRFKGKLIEAFHLSNHGKGLIRQGFEDDLVYCAQIDMVDIIPEFKDGVIRSSFPFKGEGKGEGS